MPDVKLEVKPLVLKASIDVETVPADLQEWDAQNKILQNTGIERDGGITNLYTQIESNSEYEEVFFTRNGKRVRLERDEINNVFRVFTGDRNIGQVPQWAISDRRIVSVDANDALGTVDGTILVLRISTGTAVIEEVNCQTFELIRSRSFSIPTDITDAFFVRTKAPTWANITSIVGVFASGTVLNHKVVTDAGVVYTIGSQVGFTNSSHVFAYYERGWIVSSCDPNDPRTFLLRSDGTQQGTFTEATFLVANYNRIADTIAFRGYRNVVALGTPGTYGNAFTPPAVLGGSWTITAITGAASSPAAVNMTFGGYALAYGASPKVLFYDNNTGSTRLWTIGHATPPEIYGYIDNGSPIAIKTHTILGAGSYLSASFAADGIGVPITEIGELDGYYYPQIVQCTSGKYRVMYRRGDGKFGTVQFSEDPDVDRLQEIAPGVVKINTISALCIADANDNDLQYCGNAYNGFVVVGYDSVAPLAVRAHVARYRGDWGGSVDTGYKTTGAITLGQPNLVVVPESVQFSPSNETIDVYFGDPPASISYYRSIRDGNSQSIKSSLRGTLYVDDQIIPPPQGVPYSEQTIILIGSTAIREFNYDGYQLFNETVGQYQSFRLYGQLYLFDGDWIHSTLLSANVLQQVDHVAQALGLQLLAESPTAIYFFSDFDNSLYSFDGGQSVNKILRMNQRTEILSGAFNVRENTLAMFGDDFVLWMRDGILSESALPFSAPFRVFSTSDGIWITKDDYSIRYVYNPVAGSIIIPIDIDLDGGIWGTAYPDTYDGGMWGSAYPDTYVGEVWGGGSGTIDTLIWQSKFNGFSDRLRQSIDRYLFRVYKQDKAETTIAIEYQAYREAGILTENRSLTIPITAYDANGYAVIEFIPANKNAVASSIQLTFPDKIILLDGHVTLSGLAGDTTAKIRA